MVEIKTNEKANKSVNMAYYLKRYWKENTLAIFSLVILCGFQVGAYMLMMQSIQGIIDRNMNRFMLWMLFSVVVWFLIYGLTGVETYFQSRVIRIMNNAIRQDIVGMLLKKSYQNFHEQSVGEYLSQFTNDISQIENLAWNPFFDCIRSAYVKGFVGAGMGCVNIVCQMLHIALIGVLSVRGIILLGAVTGGGNLCGNLSAGLGSMTQDVLSMSSAKPYFEKISAPIKESIESHTEINGKPIDKKPIEMMQNGITMKNVSFRYDKKAVLKSFNAHFERGGKYALIGSSGCGKSTLLKLMLGCLPEYTGSIRFDNQEIRDYKQEQLWQQISYIEQDVFLFDAPILDNTTVPFFW